VSFGRAAAERSRLSFAEIADALVVAGLLSPA